MHSRPPGISVVVPTFNRRESLRRLLDSLASQTHPTSDFEVVVVDDGSSDGTAGLVRGQQLPFALRILEQPHQGPASARNLGVANASGTIILFLDDDVLPPPDLIARHAAAHSAAAAAVIGPMSPPLDWPRSPWVRWEEDMLEWQYQAMKEQAFECSPRQFYTGNASLPKALFLASGGFDSRFSRAEDVELGYRLRENGARFVFLPEAHVFHYASRSFDSWCRTPYQYGRFEVVMQREKGHETLHLAALEFHGRHLANRLLARVCVGRPRVVRGVVAALRHLATAADRVGARRLAGLALSAIFNLLYWQGICDELGGADDVWRRVDGARPPARSRTARPV